MKQQKRKTARIILHTQFPLITVALIAILISYLNDRRIDPLLANRTYPAFLEYILASIAIVLGGCLLAELGDQSTDEKE